MSRAATQPSFNGSGFANRPSAGQAQQGRFGGATQGFGGGAATQGFGGGAAAQGGLGGAQSFQRPSPGQLNDFLNQGSRGASAVPGHFNYNPQATFPGSGGGSKTYQTPGGSTITIAGGSGSKTTAGGATVGGAGAGIKIEGAGGQTYVSGRGVAGATKDGNSAVVAGQGRAGQTAGGATAGRISAGGAASNGNRTVVGGGTAAGVRGPNGGGAVGVRTGIAGSGGFAHTSAGVAVRGPAGQSIAAARGATFINGQFVGGRQWAAVNGSFTHWNCYRPAWYTAHPGAWYTAGLITGAWIRSGWAATASYCGCTGEPMYYDYGGSLAYQDGSVYNGDQPIATADEYYQQAEQIAAAGDTAANDQWLTLGVFAITKSGETTTDKVVQLAVNNDGVIRGNLYDALTDQVAPLTGAIDKPSQRVAIRIEGNDKMVAETSLYNLTNDEVPMLVHFDADRQEIRTLVRLEDPTTESKP